MKQLYGYQKIYLLLFFFSMLVSCGGGRSDQQIQQDVQEKLSVLQEGSNQAFTEITAVVKEGVVTLTGQCTGERCADSAVALVKDINGVKNIVNNIKQGPQQTDLTLRTSVQTIISKYQGVQADVAGGVVVLRGTIQREQIQPLMNELGPLQAKKIDNQLAIVQ